MFIICCFFVNTIIGDIVDKNIDIDNRKLNQVLRICSKVLKRLHVLVLILSIYIGILIVSKLNIMLFVTTILKILSPLFIGIVIAWLFRPLIRWLTNRGMNRIFSVILVYIVIILVCYLVLRSFIPIFTKEASEFINIIPNILNHLSNMLDGICQKFKIDFSDIGSIIPNEVNKFALERGRDIPITVVNLIKGISSFLLGLIIGFYLLITDGTFIDDALNNFLKKDTYEFVVKINIILRNYVKGTLLSSFLVFILSTIAFYIVGLKGALLFGLICGLTNIIPFIGPYLGALIPVLVGFTKGITFGIIVAIVVFVIQTIEGNVIHPLIMSKSIKIHPVSVIISLLVFGYFFGIIGMIVATPLIAILKELYFYVVKRYDSYKRKLIR